MKIIADKNIPFIQDYFSSYGELILKSGRDIAHADVKDADILLVRAVTRVDQHLLHGSKITFVGSVTTGADHLDTQWLDAAGIAWANAHGFNAPAVADYVVSIIASLNKMNFLHQENKRAAVIGVGKIGRLVSEILKKLHFTVILCDPLLADSEKNFVSTSLEEIHDVDFITLHVPLTHHDLHPTYHFIDKKFLQRQKENCILLNINQEILKKALIATPHIAGYSLQSKQRGIAELHQIMIEKKIIADKKINVSTIPKYKLTLTRQCSWQDIVLEVFNPLLMTDIMRGHILISQHPEAAFDQLRNQFQERYEFASVELTGQVEAQDKMILKELGFVL
jgi:erythronate-4-phosphate dehydrogenase